MAITLAELNIIASKHRFNINLTEKDYILTHILYCIREVKGIYFKGGTALHKIFLDYGRLSEDLDFTVTRPIAEVEKEIKKCLESTRFSEITHDKRVEHFVRLVVHYKLYHQKGTVFIDLNRKGKLILPAEKHIIKHFYDDLPQFSVNTLAKKEMLAEKMAASIGRNKPRDHFDLYQIIKRNIPIDLKLVQQKCEDSEHEFNILKMFNRAKKLKNRWDEDLLGMIPDNITFAEVMKTLAKHFELREEKDKNKG